MLVNQEISSNHVLCFRHQWMCQFALSEWRDVSGQGRKLRVSMQGRLHWQQLPDRSASIHTSSLNLNYMAIYKRGGLFQPIEVLFVVDTLVVALSLMWVYTMSLDLCQTDRVFGLVLFSQIVCLFYLIEEQENRTIIFTLYRPVLFWSKGTLEYSTFAPKSHGLG